MSKEPESPKQRDVHFCATCINIEARPATAPDTGVRFFCSRLGYETKPRYKFNCWTPRPQYTTDPH